MHMFTYLEVCMYIRVWENDGLFILTQTRFDQLGKYNILSITTMFILNYKILKIQ